MADEYLIWSNEHRAWWRGERCGYTVHVNSAGIYSREEAIQICVGSQNGWQSESAPYEIPVRLADAAACRDRVAFSLLKARGDVAALTRIRANRAARQKRYRAKIKAEKLAKGGG